MGPSESPSIPAALPLPLPPPGQRMSENRVASPQPLHSGNSRPLDLSGPCGGVTAAPPGLSQQANNDRRCSAHLLRHNQNSPATTTPSRPGGCASSTAASRFRTTTYPKGHRATASPPLRKCRTARVSGVGPASPAVVGLRVLPGRASWFTVAGSGCAGKIIRSGRQPSPPWDLGGLRIWVRCGT